MIDLSEADGFYASILNSLPQQIAIIDARGVLEWVNRSWQEFSVENGGKPDLDWRGINYLHVCGNSPEEGERHGGNALTGIQAVIRGDAPIFHFEYPCHSPTQHRWFMMSIRPVDWNGPRRFVVTHQDITKRKLQELKFEEMAVLDSVTGIANRRCFDEFLEGEWRRAQRNGHSVSMVLFDIDSFKPYNDNYGHLAGDECLRRVGTALRPIFRRPGDLPARYGGDEFAVILGDTNKAAAYEMAGKIRAAICALNIPHEYATSAENITISAGVSTIHPKSKSNASPLKLIEAADQALYEAKGGGRNRVCAG